MAEPNSAQDFIKSVCQQIRAKRAHEHLTGELLTHIESQKAAYIADGMDEDTAERKAVMQMGDPVVVGQQLDRTHRPKPDWIVFSLTAILVLFGAAIQYYMSTVAARVDTHEMFAKHLIYVAIGIAVLVIIYFVDYTILGKYPKILFGALVLIGILTFCNSPVINGATRHVFYVVLLFIPAFAGIAYSQRKKGYLGLLICCGFYPVPAVLCPLAPTLAGLIQSSTTCFVILAVAIAKGWFDVKKPAAFALICTPIVLTISYALAKTNFLHNRVIAILNPELDPSGGGYTGSVVQSLISGSKFWGAAAISGRYASHATETILPNWNTDFMLTYLISKAGYAVGILVVLLFGLLIARMFVATFRQKSALGFIVSLSVTLTITLQSLFYVLSNLVGPLFLPETLPFLSFGGTGLVVNMALIGLMLSAFRNKDLVRDSTVAARKKRRQFFSFEDGKLTIDLNLK